MLVFFVGLFILDASLLSYSKNFGDGVLKVAFLDIGQGDSIFIESPTGVQVLVDAGDGQYIMRQLPKFMSLSDRNIDAVVGTHPDKDHIGGIPKVLSHYNISWYLETDLYRETGIQDEIYKILKTKNIPMKNPIRGDILDIGGGAYVQVLFPDRSTDDFESNTASIGLRLVYGQTSFLLTGDMPQAVEKYLSYLDGDFLESEVLKAGHHGSKTSSAPLFIDNVSPKYVVVSAGLNNRYGHPNKEAIDILSSEGAEILRTYENKNIVFLSDGKNLEISYK